MNKDEDSANAFQSDSQFSIATQASEGARNTAYESELAGAFEATVGSGGMGWSSSNDTQEYTAMVEADYFNLPVINGEEGLE